MVDKLDPYFQQQTTKGFLDAQIGMRRIQSLTLLLICLCVVYPELVSADGVYEKMECGGKVTLVESTCERSSEHFPNCSDQVFWFHEDSKVARKKRILAREKSSEEFYMPYIFDAWTCVTAQKGDSYLILRATNGNLCAGCVWYELLSIDGQRLTPKGKNFDTLHNRLGWSEEIYLFKPITLLGH